jgi:hypothetical protein
MALVIELASFDVSSALIVGQFFDIILVFPQHIDGLD